MDDIGTDNRLALQVAYMDGAPAPGKLHTPIACYPLGSTAQYHYKNWSKVFQCSLCGRSGRFNTNFLGHRNVVCDGIRFTKVRR